MKIVPGLPAPDPSRPVAQRDGVERPFSSYLGADERRGAGRTFGFSELGMFGHGGGRPACAPGEAATHAAEPAREEGSSPPRVATPPDEPTRHALAAAHNPAAQFTDTKVFGSAARVPPRTGEPPATTGAMRAETAGGAADAKAPEQATRPMRPAFRTATPKSGPSLTFFEKDGAVELLVRTPDADPETRSALRRLVRSILARSGLSLARLRLNGASVALHPTITSGDPNGTRSD
jgi:hypothetical protein